MLIALTRADPSLCVNAALTIQTMSEAPWLATHVTVCVPSEPTEARVDALRGRLPCAMRDTDAVAIVAWLFIPLLAVSVAYVHPGPIVGWCGLLIMGGKSWLLRNEHIRI